MGNIYPLGEYISWFYYWTACFLQAISGKCNYCVTSVQKLTSNLTFMSSLIIFLFFALYNHTVIGDCYEWTIRWMDRWSQCIGLNCLVTRMSSRPQNILVFLDQLLLSTEIWCEQTSQNTCKWMSSSVSPFQNNN